MTKDNKCRGAIIKAIVALMKENKMKLVKASFDEASDELISVKFVDTKLYHYEEHMDKWYEITYLSFNSIDVYIQLMKSIYSYIETHPNEIQ